MSAELDSQPVRNDKGLKKGAIGVVSATVIGVASTAPAYSAACTLGPVLETVPFVPPPVRRADVPTQPRREE